MQAGRISPACRDLRRAREHFTQLDRIVSEIVSEIASETVSEIVSEIVWKWVGKFACPDAGLSARPAASFAQWLGFEVVILEFS